MLDLVLVGVFAGFARAGWSSGSVRRLFGLISARSCRRTSRPSSRRRSPAACRSRPPPDPRPGRDVGGRPLVLPETGVRADGAGRGMTQIAAEGQVLRGDIDPRNRDDGRLRKLDRSGLIRALAVEAALLMTAGAVAISAIWQMVRANFPAHGTPFADWQHYAMAWNRVASGGPLYAPEQLSGPFAFPSMLFVGWAYSPPSVLFWAPFATWPAGYVLWTTVNVGLLLTALWAVASRTWPEHRIWGFALTLLILSQYQPFVVGAALGNADVALTGLLLWAWLGGPRAAVVAGVLGGAAKVAPLAVLVYVRRFGWRWTLYGVGSLVALIVLTLPLVGLHSYFEYAHSLALAVAPCGAARPDNLSIACQFSDFGTGKAVGLVLGIGMGIASGFVRNRLLAFSLAALAYPVANHDLRTHSWLPIVAVVGAWLTTLRARSASIRTA
jgi:Glycosyltransferase family 87